MDRVVADALKPYENLHLQIDDMEECVNNKKEDLSIPDIARFTVILKQAQTDIVELKGQLVLVMFDSAFVEIDGEEDLVDLMGKLQKSKGKVIDKSREKIL